MTSSASESREPAVPVGLRAYLAHAALQVIASEDGLDLLHIKGPAVSPEIGRPRTGSTDADVLVRPEHVGSFLDLLAAHGWTPVTSFETGSAFEHAATYFHDSWGYADVHKVFPGMRAHDAFEQLWQGRQAAKLAGIVCAVPGLSAQRLLLLLHLARNGAGEADPDYARAWSGLERDARDAIRRLAVSLDAEVALAAALGQLDLYADDPAHDLWQVFSGSSHSRLSEWSARVKAAPGAKAKTRLALRALLVNRDHLAMRLHRQPTRSEIAQEFFHRLGAGVSEIRRALRK
nr:nucleotidyltransferase family protein [Actinomyces sp.]